MRQNDDSILLPQIFSRDKGDISWLQNFKFLDSPMSWVYEYAHFLPGLYTVFQLEADSLVHLEKMMTPKLRFSAIF